MTPSLCAVEPEEDFYRVESLSAWIPLCPGSFLRPAASHCKLRGVRLCGTQILFSCISNQFLKVSGVILCFGNIAIIGKRGPREVAIGIIMLDSVCWL